MPDFPPVVMVELPKNKAVGYLTGNQTLPQDVWTKVAINAVGYDALSEFDLVNHRFVAKTAGYYLVLANLSIGNAVTGNPYFGMLVTNNNTFGDLIGAPINAYRFSQDCSHQVTVGSYTGCPYMKLVGIIYLGVGDWVEMWVEPTGSATSQVASAKGETNLFIARVPHG